MKRTLLSALGSTVLLAAATAAPLAAQLPSQLPIQVIVQSRGVDSRVDYASLTRFGPWDDRNYRLTVDDLALLPAADPEATEAIPAFFRVGLRRDHPELAASGPAQYPRSGLPAFFQRHGGYLIDGTLYRQARREEDGWRVVLEDGVDLRDYVLEFLEGEVRVTDPNGAAESAVAINPVDPDLVIAGSNGPGGGQRMHFSTDGGESWAPAAALPLGGTCCDPTVGWSADGTKAYAATLGIPELFFYRSADGGQTWTDLPGNGRVQVDNGAGFVDKEYLHVDLHPGSPQLDNLYMTWHEGNTMRFSRSTDLGTTWSAELTLSSGASESGIGSDITSDGGGRVYYFWPAFQSRKIWVRRSTDGGVSFEPTVEVASTEGAFDFPIPSMETRNVFIYVAADTDRTGGPFDGSVYASWTDNTGPDSGTPANNHARIQVAYSRDAGATWTVVTPHETADQDSVDRWHQWLAVAPDGSVHVVFYDTRRDPTRSSVDLFHSFSTDGAQTFSTPERLTAVQSPNIADGFEFGDYNGLDAVLSNYVAVFTDNRAETEAGGDSVDVYAAGAGLAVIFADGFESGDVSGWDGTGSE